MEDSLNMSPDDFSDIAPTSQKAAKEREEAAKEQERLEAEKEKRKKSLAEVSRMSTDKRTRQKLAQEIKAKYEKKAKERAKKKERQALLGQMGKTLPELFKRYGRHVQPQGRGSDRVARRLS